MRRPRLGTAAGGLARRRSAGVTLIEVLIAVTLLSLLTLGMLFAMRIGLGSLGITDRKLMMDRRVAGAQRLLQSELEGLIPFTLASCGGTEVPRATAPALFQGDPQAMRLVSAFSLEQAWRGHPQILQLFVVQAADGPGVRLAVNEIPYTRAAAAQGCMGLAVDHDTGQPSARFAPPQASEHSFVLADRLAYCRFSYLVKPPPNTPQFVPKWQPTAPGSSWPLAIRVEMAPVEPNPSQLEPITVTAPIYVYRSPQIEYGDF